MRRRDCKVDFIWICKIPQSFFCSKKTTAPFTREPLTDSRKGCPYSLRSQNKAFLWRGRWHAAGVTEGEITKICCLLLSLPQFRYAQQLPRRGSGMFNVNFNLIVTDNCFVFIGLFGQPQGLSLRSHKFSNLMKHRLPLTRELSFFFWKMTEGEITKVWYLLLSLLPSRLRRATFLVRGRLYST